ncbi:MAG: hypothetical protein ABF289_10845 [Clostridiales bacterium]
MSNLDKIKRKKYAIGFFFVFIITIIILMTKIIPSFMIFTQQKLLTDRHIVLDEISESSFEHQLMWWEIEDEKMILEVKNLKEIKSPKIYGIVVDSKSDEIVLKNKEGILDKKYFGSFNSSVEPFKYDIDGDGKKETINLFAKLDSVFTQGMAINTTFFEKEKIKLEVSQLDFHHVGVKFNGAFLANKEISVYSKNGKEERIKLDNRGTFKVNTIKGLTSGITVVYSENESVYISNYMIERNSLFSESYKKALYPLIFVIAVAFDIILLLNVLRFNPFRRRIVIEEIRNIES